MIKYLRTYAPYKGFILSNEIVIDDYLCIFTGKNGCGKTRLIGSLLNGKASILERDAIENTLEVLTLNLNEVDRNLLYKFEYKKMVEYCSQSILEHIFTLKDDEALIDIRIDLKTEEANGFNIEFLLNLNNLSELTKKYLNKDLRNVSDEELKLMLCIENFLLKNISIHPVKSFLSLSCLVQNYFLAKRINELLTALALKDENISYVSPELISSEWRSDPYTLTNDIIMRVFNGKFSISPPKIGSEHLFYAPELIENSTSTPIRVQDLSNGERTIFMLAAMTVNSISFTPSQDLNIIRVILLDEPDAHLHPKMVNDMYECFDILNKKLNVHFILTTHSATTVALSPTNNIFTIKQENVTENFFSDKISKDAAISELLDGINTMSIDPENNRQVYVESSNDMAIYNEIYKYLYNNGNLRAGINLNFIPAGKKYNKDHIIKIAEDAGISTSTIASFDHFAVKLNGEGNCVQVESTVHSLSDVKTKTVRGIIDWDSKNIPSKNVVVNGEGVYYSIENIIYEPVIIFLTLTTLFPFKYSNSDFCSAPDDEGHNVIMSSSKYLQEITDNITYKILGVENKRDQQAFFLKKEINIFGDKRYCNPRYNDNDNGINGIKNGHHLEDKIINTFQDLRGERVKHQNINGGLMLKIVRAIIIRNQGGAFINKCFLDTFLKLQ